MSNHMALDLTRLSRFLLALVAIFLIAMLDLVGIGKAQEPDLKFEVASIKPNKTIAGGTYIRSFPGRLVITNMSVREMITWAYHIKDYQLSETPAWSASDHYDLEAKASLPGVGEQEERRMLRSLLEERLALRVHRETRTMAAYALKIGKTGSRLQESKPGSCLEIDPDKPPANLPATTTVCGSDWLGRNMIAMTRVGAGNLAQDLSYVLNRSVIDRTGLTGFYDVNLKFAADEATVDIGGSHSGQSTSDTGSPSIFTAIEEQLGLKLESTKGPVDVTVVDHIERPAGD